MIDRYARPAMKQVWSEESKNDKWLQVELAASTRWGLESIFGLFEEQGRSRRIKR